MDARPTMFRAIGALWDFAFGSLLIGAAPLATMFGLDYLLDLPSNFLYWHFGERTAYYYSTAVTGIALFLACPAFGVAIWWRTRHRVLSTSLLPFEVLVAVVWAFCFIFLLGVLIGPNDNWDKL